MTPRSSSRFTRSDVACCESPILRPSSEIAMHQSSCKTSMIAISVGSSDDRWFCVEDRLDLQFIGNAERLPIIIYSTPKRKLALFTGAAARGTDMADIVILPGIGGSGETHWQSHWEKANSRMRRFEPMNWEQPDL